MGLTDLFSYRGRTRSARIAGALELITRHQLVGWAWDPDRPGAPVELEVLVGGTPVARVLADAPRADIAVPGVRGPRHGLLYEWPSPMRRADLAAVSVRPVGSRKALATTEQTLQLSVPPAEFCGSDLQLNINTIDGLMEGAPDGHAFVRFDPNENCNLHCVYCHNYRSTRLVEPEALTRFLESRVDYVENFQFGCIMEPTLDARLVDFMAQVADSPGRPRRRMILQTNGLLLNRHDHRRMAEAGLTHLSVSLDCAEPGTQKALRGGMSLDRVVRNVRSFQDACPDVQIEFIATVTKANIDSVAALVELGLSLGIQRYTFREVFYMPENSVVDHARMPDLVLDPGQFDRMRADMEARYGDDSFLVFADGAYLDRSVEKIRADSYRG